MSDRVIDQTIAELQAVLRGQQLATDDGTVEQHDRWTRTAGMMLGTAVDALVFERDRADNAEQERDEMKARIDVTLELTRSMWLSPDERQKVRAALGGEMATAENERSDFGRIVDAAKAAPHG